MKKIILCVLFCFASASFAATQPKQLTVILDWFPNPDHAPLVIAKQQGYFKEQGLDVELIRPADPNDAPKLVAARKADIGITYEPEFMQQVDQGLPLIRIGTLIDKPLNCIVALKESNIKTVADLKGKHIGSTSSGLTNAMLKVMLGQKHLSEKDVDIINVRYNLTQALLAHKVDAVTGMMRNFEVPQLELAGHKVVTFFPEEHGIPNYSELVFVTNTAILHDKRLPRFLSAIKKAVVYLDEHPKEAWADFAKEYPAANNALNQEAWFATLSYFSEDPAGFNSNDWEQFSRFMHEHGLIKSAQPATKYAVTLR